MAIPSKSNGLLITVSLSDILDPNKPATASILRLMSAANDAAFLNKTLLLHLHQRSRANKFEKLSHAGENYYLLRLICAHLFEAGLALRELAIQNKQSLADLFNDNKPAIEALKKVTDILCDTTPTGFNYRVLGNIRNFTAFHYKPEKLKAALKRKIAEEGFGDLAIAEFDGFTRYIVIDELNLKIIEDTTSTKVTEDGFHKIFAQATKTVGDLQQLVNYILMALIADKPVKKQTPYMIPVPFNMQRISNKVRSRRKSSDERKA